MSNLNHNSKSLNENFLDSSTDSQQIHWNKLGAELVFIHDNHGRYLEFYWQLEREYGIVPQEIINHLPEGNFCPVDLESYQETLQRVIRSRIPEQYNGLFSYQNQVFSLALVISPILTSKDEIDRVLVMGHRVQEKTVPLTNAIALSPEPYQKLLAKVSRKIRRTLHLQTIWQETVDSIGESLQVSRCLMLAKDSAVSEFTIKAEFCREEVSCLLGQGSQCPLSRLNQSLLEQDKPIFLDCLESSKENPCSILIVPTFHQDQCNGFMYVQQCDRLRYWTPETIEFLQELAAQVGTAIAQALVCQELEQATRIAQEASQLKSEFLASTTHELRTPLNGIIGFLKLVLDDMADSEEEKHEFLEEAYQSALHLLNLINDILDLAKIESGKIDRELSIVDLEEVCQTVNNFVIPQIQAKQLDFYLKLPSTLTPIVVYGNSRWILQVMLNIVGNALKFTPNGKITIKGEIIKQKIQWQDKIFPGTIKISVTDTGIGVSLEKQAKLFEKFVQIDGSRTKAYGGTGLGLSISQKLVEAMGGTIAFFSMGEELGSTVTFSVLLDHLPVLKTEKTN